MAKLPNFDAAIVESAMLTDYLLSGSHPRGSAKARFLEHFGFSASRIDEARLAFLRHAAAHDISASIQAKYGMQYEIEGALMTPDGQNPIVTTVWMIDIGSSVPRLITMLPRARRAKST